MSFERTVILGAAVAMLLPAGLLSSCSVKEDRTECPCTLRVNLSRVDSGRLMERGYDKLHIGAGSFPDSPVQLEGMPEEVVYDMPRGALHLFALAAPDSCVSADGAVVVHEGSQFPEVYAYYMAGAIKRSRTDTVRLHKSWCTLEIRLMEAPAPHAAVEVSGTISGYDALGELVEGRFAARAMPDAGGVCAVRVPRQRDGSLRLSLEQGRAVSRTFAIGESILAQGYDWTADDLEDISIIVNLSSAQLAFSADLYDGIPGLDVVF